jgi:hypothetical protein
MSLKKYPLFLEGETVVFSQLGLANLFEMGFDQAVYTRGVNGKVFFGNGVSLNGDLTLEVSNDGAFLLGEVNLSGSLAGISVRGQITDQGIILEGEGDVNIKFGDGATLAANLHLLADSNQGVFLDGFLETPLQVAAVEVTGEVSARGLMLRGMINGKVDFGVTALQSNLSLSASSWDGARLSGMIDVPLVVIGGKTEVSGEILTQNLFSLDSSSAFLDFTVASAAAGISLGFSPTDIAISSNAELCLAATGCADYGISFNPDWGNGSVSACVTFVDEICIDL